MPTGWPKKRPNFSRGHILAYFASENGSTKLNLVVIY